MVTSTNLPLEDGTAIKRQRHPMPSTCDDPAAGVVGAPSRWWQNDKPAPLDLVT